MEKLTVEEGFNTVNKLHKVLSDLIAEGKGDFKLSCDNDYDYTIIEEVKVYDEPNDKRVILY